MADGGGDEANVGVDAEEDEDNGEEEQKADVRKLRALFERKDEHTSSSALNPEGFRQQQQNQARHEREEHAKAREKLQHPNSTESLEQLFFRTQREQHHIEMIEHYMRLYSSKKASDRDKVFSRLYEKIRGEDRSSESFIPLLQRMLWERGRASGSPPQQRQMDPPRPRERRKSEGAESCRTGTDCGEAPSPASSSQGIPFREAKQLFEALVAAGDQSPSPSLLSSPQLAPWRLARSTPASPAPRWTDAPDASPILNHTFPLMSDARRRRHSADRSSPQRADVASIALPRIVGDLSPVVSTGRRADHREAPHRHSRPPLPPSMPPIGALPSAPSPSRPHPAASVPSPVHRHKRISQGRAIHERLYWRMGNYLSTSVVDQPPPTANHDSNEGSGLQRRFLDAGSAAVRQDGGMSAHSSHDGRVSSTSEHSSGLLAPAASGVPLKPHFRGLKSLSTRGNETDSRG
ncbi:unnamed protein product [Vitrella brassicaformis CCMP3155]|uniref:Uncharacterized protein n=2 Tax=Vitrella brassicaformis TaxID=1169539 RepID=A0A0G4FVI9_VITBC|nr:unnamed protein product [Vitrella brassicaformis CCMP3155]|eukprot:CEM18556.1 unnamed protein product [Vitrella brassicaformis CCMP3155]